MPAMSPALLLVLLLVVTGPARCEILNELNQVMSEVSTLYRALMEKLQTHGGFRNCREVRELGGANEDGVYIIYPYDCCPQKPVKVWCDMKTEGGGWTVVQRRENCILKEEFTRSFREYALGFGEPTQDHWLGLDHIHAMTDQSHHQVRIEMTNFQGNRSWVEYGFFYIDGGDKAYTIEARYYRGNADDALSTHTGAQFRDMDMYSAKDVSMGGWWHTRDRRSNLNGSYRMPGDACRAGVFWISRRGCESLKATIIMIRPTF